MRYNGGKSSCCKEIAKIINREIERKGVKTYWEPFVGAGNIIVEIEAEFRVGTDKDVSIISLLKAVASGWDPPNQVSELEYKLAKTIPETDPMHGFIKYGCSFGGKPWGGYARSRDRNYAQNARNSLLKIRPKLQGILFDVSDYRNDFTPELIYCDPPYKGTTSVGCNEKFDSDSFWSWVRKQECIVFISERTAPDDFTCIWEKSLKDGLGKSKLTERLFVRK